VSPHRATNRVENGVERGEPFAFTLDGATIEAFPGETVAAALLAANIRTLRRTEKTGAPRGVFCGMGVCFDCLIVVDGRSHLRACLTEAVPGMVVMTQDEAAWRAGRA
jgi:predicted molibdopterin-dependent oxidoreductase YjgC